VTGEEVRHFVGKEATRPLSFPEYLLAVSICSNAALALATAQCCVVPPVRQVGEMPSKYAASLNSSGPANIGAEVLDCKWPHVAFANCICCSGAARQLDFYFLGYKHLLMFTKTHF